MSNSVYELSDNDFIELIRSSHNIGEVLFKLKLSVKGNTWGYNQVKQRMKKLHITHADFVGRSNIKMFDRNKDLPDEELFKENCEHSRNALRKRLILNDLIPYKCAICGIDSWQDNPISLELDHINGVNNDNRIENLRFLCPNCHSQTSTYGSKNSIIKHPSDKHYDITDEDKQIILDSYNKLKNRESVARETRYHRSIVRTVLNEAYVSPNAKNQKFVIRYDLDGNEIKRWGSITECCKDILDSKETDAITLKGIKGRFLRNSDKIWLNSKWEIVNGNEYV